MSTSMTYLVAQEQVDDLRREARRSNQLREAPRHDLPRGVQQNRDRVKVRRIAVIRPAGSHFAVMPTRGLLDARGR